MNDEKLDMISKNIVFKMLVECSDDQFDSVEKRYKLIDEGFKKAGVSSKDGHKDKYDDMVNKIAYHHLFEDYFSGVEQAIEFVQEIRQTVAEQIKEKERKEKIVFGLFCDRYGNELLSSFLGGNHKKLIDIVNLKRELPEDDILINATLFLATKKLSGIDVTSFSKSDLFQ